MHGRFISLRLITLLAVIAGITLDFSPTVAARPSSKVVLLIGNSKYVNTRKLVNPANDVGALATTFRKIGFDVQVGLDVSYVEMRRVLRKFADLSAKADIAVIYFAGHGIERSGENYLLPIDAKLERDIDLEYEAITLSSVLLAVMPATKLRLVVLDACRTNPFNEQMKLSIGLTRSVTRGLARIEPQGDVLVAYSAKAGTVALDGEGDLSPYAAAMLKHLEGPGLDIRLLMGKVRDDVMAATSRKQEPFIYGSLSGDVIALVPASLDKSDLAEQSLLVAEERKKAAAAEVQRKLEQARAAEAQLKLRLAEEKAKREKQAAEAAEMARRKAEEQSERDRAAKEEAERERLAAQEEAKRLAGQAEQEREEIMRKARTLTFRVTNAYKYKIYLSFHAQSRNAAWPGGDEVYYIDDSREHEYSLSCIPGEQICYGAYSGNFHWGCGQNCQQSCTGCCHTCGAGGATLRLGG